MAGKFWKTAAALGALLVVVSTAAAATPDVASMTLQPADVPGAKVTHQGAIKETGYLAAYSREFAFASPSGSAKLIDLEAEVMVAASAATASKDVARAETGFRSKAGRALFVKTIAREAKVKASAVAVGKLRKVAGYDQGFELPVSVKVKAGRIFETLVYLRIDRVAVLMLEVGLRPIGGTTTKYAAAIAAHIGTALTPTSVSPPAISGTPQQGQTLTASPGTWSVDDATFTYQWQHCDAAGANCVAIAGATAQTYVVSAADVGATLRVVVTASNRFGAPTATSAQTAIVS
jgi:hypothetical protein